MRNHSRIRRSCAASNGHPASVALKEILRRAALPWLAARRIHETSGEKILCGAVAPAGLRSKESCKASERQRGARSGIGRLRRWRGSPPLEHPRGTSPRTSTAGTPPKVRAAARPNAGSWRRCRLKSHSGYAGKASEWPDDLPSTRSGLPPNRTGIVGGEMRDARQPTRLAVLTSSRRGEPDLVLFDAMKEREITVRMGNAGPGMRSRVHGAAVALFRLSLKWEPSVSR